MTMQKKNIAVLYFCLGLFNLLLQPILLTQGCSPADIVVNQAPTQALPNGIPTYTVEISNLSPTTAISHIHLKCGWFSSARLVNPRIFRWLSFDDCLVNDGLPLASGRTLSFRYATTFPYTLLVKEVYCSTRNL